jgi:hypothetical protein
MDDRNRNRRDQARNGQAHPDRDRGMGTRDYAYGQQDALGRDDRDGWQRGREHTMSDWERGFHHGRAVGEQGYGAEYRGHDGYGGSPERGIGRGPKNYVRTDERMREEICERLIAQAHDWSDVEVHVSDGEATLTGTVRSRDMKYEAERVAASVSGIKDVTNQLRVKSATRWDAPEADDARAEPANGHDKRNRSTLVSR